VRHAGGDVPRPKGTLAHDALERVVDPGALIADVPVHGKDSLEPQRLHVECLTGGE